MAEDLKSRALEIALESLDWDYQADVVAAAEKLFDAGFDNSDRIMSLYMAGRLIDAYRAALLALKEGK